MHVCVCVYRLLAQPNLARRLMNRPYIFAFSSHSLSDLLTLRRTKVCPHRHVHNFDTVPVGSTFQSRGPTFGAERPRHYVALIWQTQAQGSLRYLQATSKLRSSARHSECVHSFNSHKTVLNSCRVHDSSLPNYCMSPYGPCTIPFFSCWPGFMPHRATNGASSLRLGR